MNAKKASPEGRTKKRTFPWLRRVLLAVLIAAAAVLAWLRLPAPLDQLVADHQSELGLEEALNQAGYSSCAVLLQNGALTVIVASSDMTAEASAAILSLCTAHTDIGVENIRIMAREEP